MKKGGFLKALKVCKEILQRPDAGETELELAFGKAGECYFNLQIMAEAEDYFRQALRFNPFSARSHYLLGLTLSRMSRFRESVFELKTARQMLPGNPEVLRSLGFAMFLAGYPTAGERTIRKAIQLNPKDIYSYCDLAVLYINRYEYTKAEAVLKEAEKSVPNNETVRKVFLACRSFRKIHQSLKAQKTSL